MRMAGGQRAFVLDGGSVRAYRDEGLFERISHVIFRMMEINGRDRAAVLGQQLEQNIEGRLARGLDDFAHALAFELLVLRITKRHQQHSFPTASSSVMVVPVRAGNTVEDLAFQSRAQRRVL